MHNLTILIPGLFSSVDGLSRDTVPAHPALETLLVKARRRRYNPVSFLTLLCDQFGLRKVPGQDLPVAAITRLIDDAERPQGVWMRADPVHLSVAMTGITLLDPAALSLTQHDAIILGAPLKQLFAEFGWEFEIPVANRWYLRLKQAPALETSEPDQVIGNDIRRFMPVGEDKSRWEVLHNEAQMLLHASEINHDRENSGQKTVNSLWFWGAGPLPEILPRKWSRLFSNSPVAQGLAMLAATPFEGLPASAGELISNDGVSSEDLLVMAALRPYSHYQDFSAWHAAFDDLEQNWLVPVLTALQQGKLDRITIHTDGNIFTVSRKSLHKFWRRPQSLLEFP